MFGAARSETPRVLLNGPGLYRVSRNTFKGLAVSVGLVWNFCFYKFFV